MSRLTQKIKNLLRYHSREGARSRPTSRRLGVEWLEARWVPAGNATALVTGVAFIDFNASGTRQPQEIILPGIQTNLVGTTNQGVAVNVSVTTDSAGAYSFQDVQPGTYQLNYPPAPGLIGGSDGTTLVSQFAVQGGQTVTQDIAFRGITPDGVSLRQFLNTSTSTTGVTFAPAGTGTTAASVRSNSAPVVLASANLSVTGTKNSSSLVDLASVFGDPDTTDSLVRYNTSAGAVNVELFDKTAPQTVANFFDYVKSGAYNDSIFHRVVNQSSLKVVQGGGFTLKENPTTLPAIPTLPPVKGEFGASNTAGTLAVALSGSPANVNSGTDQFFFNIADNSSALDPQGFTVFGKVVGSADTAVLNTLFSAPVSHQVAPFDNIPLNNYSGSSFPTDATRANFEVVNSITVVRQDEALTYSLVSNSNASLVQTAIKDNRLTLNYLPGQTGSASITIRATDKFGATKDATFSVTVNNTAPTVGVSLNNTAPKTNATLTATATPADANGDPVSLTYVWKVNGNIVKTTANTSTTTDTLDLSQVGNGNKGDTVTVTVTPSDGSASGSPATATATVANSVPVIDTVSITPASPLTTDTLTANVTSHDDDGDAVALTYQWLRKSVAIPGATMATLDLTTQTPPTASGDTFTVNVTPNDGTANGVVVSKTVTVA